MHGIWNRICGPHPDRCHLFLHVSMLRQLRSCAFPTFCLAMRETKEALENVSSALEIIQEGMGKLQASLAGERSSLSNTLSDPACTNGAVSPT
ncbi:hypothetical protein GOODEAATRI_001832, partial [Goodea atripinnis]